MLALSNNPTILEGGGQKKVFLSETLQRTDIVSIQSKQRTKASYRFWMSSSRTEKWQQGKLYKTRHQAVRFACWDVMFSLRMKSHRVLWFWLFYVIEKQKRLRSASILLLTDHGCGMVSRSWDMTMWELDELQPVNCIGLWVAALDGAASPSTKADPRFCGRFKNARYSEICVVVFISQINQSINQ